MHQVWVQDLGQLELDLPKLGKWVTKERIEKLGRFSGIEAKKQAAAGEYLLNTALFRLRELGELPAALREISLPARYEKNGYGAPFFPGNPLYFNWSHSGSLAALAIADTPIGIDVQKKRRYKMSVAQKCYPPNLIRQLENVKGGEADKIFFRCWTLLEAWLKAKGCGFYCFEKPQVPGGLSKKGQVSGTDGIWWDYEFLELKEGYECCVVAKSCYSSRPNRPRTVTKS